MMMNKNRAKSAVLFLVLCILAHVGQAFAKDGKKDGAPEPTDLSVLLNRIGKKVSNFKTLKTDFTQEKEMAMFKEKLVLKGRIYLQKPNMVAWHVDKPLRYSVLITDKFIRQWDEDTNQVQELSLTKNPLFQNVIRQLTVWFSGEYGSLLETNDVRLVKRTPLTLEFSPRANNDSRKVIKNITITFREDETYLQQIRMVELSGDVTTITFTNTLLNAPLDSGSLKVPPVREKSSLLSPNRDGARVSRASLRDAVDLPREPATFFNGVHPVRERRTYLSPDKVPMQLSRKDVMEGHREPVAFSNGVKHV